MNECSAETATGACPFFLGQGRNEKLVDPIAEADVYLAYGKRDHAIAILESALRTNPRDYALQKRLFEIKTVR